MLKKFDNVNNIVGILLLGIAIGGSWWHITGTVDDMSNKVSSLEMKVEEVRRETIDNRARSVAAQDVVQQNTQAIDRMFDVMHQLNITLTRIEERLK